MDSLNTQRRGISVIMPALNEERNIEAAIRTTLKAFDDMNLDGEIRVVNDGSTDGTEAIVRRMMEQDARVKILCHEKCKGIGASFWDGVDGSSKEAVIMLPGDNENDPWECFRYHSLLDHVDIVIPFVFNRATRSGFRNFLSYAYQFIINLSFFTFFNYTNGTVLYRRCILQDLPNRSAGFFYQTDMLVRLTKERGYLFAEVPYRLGTRLEGKSKAVSFRSLRRVFREYLRLAGDHYFKKHLVSVLPYPQDSMTHQRRGEEKSPS